MLCVTARVNLGVASYLARLKQHLYISFFWFSVLLGGGGWTLTAQALSFIDAERDGVEDVDGLGGASAVATTADGAFVYAVGFFDDSIAMFSRNADSGVLTYVGRISSVDINGQGLRNPTDIVVSSDNRHVYVTSSGDHSLTAFTRNVATGELALLAIYKDGVDTVEGLLGANAIAISPDNQRLYAAGGQEKTLTFFIRNADTGLLSYGGAQFDGLNGIDGIDGITDIAVSQDSTYIYIAATVDNALSVFRRNPAVSELEYVATYKNGVNDLTGLNGAYGVAASPENTFVYVVSNAASTLSVFARNVDGSLSFVEQYQDGLNNVDGVGGGRAVLVNPTGSEVYVAGTNDSGIGVFNRNPADGKLTYDSVVRVSNSAGNLLSGVNNLGVSSDGVHLYAAALLSNAVSLFSVVAADLALTVTDNAPVAINSGLTYTLTVTNRGPSTATGVTVTDTLPAGVTYNSAIASQGTCSNTANTSVTCSLGTLGANATATITLNLTAPATVGSGTLTNAATVSGDQPDSDATNNSVTTNSEIRQSVPSADLSVTVAGSVEPVATNGELIYTVTVNNLGPEVADATTLTVTLPPNATFVSATPTTEGLTCNQISGTVNCALGNLAANSSSVVNIVVTAPSSAATLNLTASVSGSKNDPVPTNNTTSLATNVTVLEVDLAISEVLANPTSVNAGDQLTYTVNIANVLLNTQATGVTLNTTLPPQTRYVSDTIGCTDNSGQLSCPFGMLDAPANPTTSVDITVQALSPGQPLGQPLQALTNTFTVTANGQDTNPTNNSQNGSIIITGNVVDLLVEATASANPVPLGDKVTYTINVSNNGNVAAGALVSVAVDADGVVNVGPVTPSSGSCTPGPIFSCNLEAIEPNGSANITVEVTPTQLGVINFQVLDAQPLPPEGVTVFEPSVPNTAQVETAVSATSADLGVTLEAVPNPALVGDNFIYTARVENLGPSPASNVVLRHTLPGGITFIEAESSQGTACSQESGIVTCNLGPINAAASAAVVVTVRPEAEGTLTSTVTVNSDTLDEQQNDNQASLDINVSQARADLTLSMTASPANVFVDNLLTYTATLTNNGPDAATQIVLTDTLPDNVVLVSNTVTPGNLGSCAVPNQNTVNCTLSNLAVNGSATVEIVVRPTLAGSLTNTATIRGQQFDPDETDNTVNVTTRVNNPASVFYVEAEQDGVNGVQGLLGVNDVAVSPDGAHVYAAGFNSNSLAVFNRNDRDGSLSFTQAILDGGNGADGLAGASAVAVSPDGTQVYVTGFGEAALAVFNRNTSNGTLSYATVYKNGIESVTGLDGAFDLLLSADGAHVYVASVTAGAVAVFSRAADTGLLNFVEAQTGIEGMDGPNALALSPDGLQLIAGNANSGSFTVFTRDVSSGQLSNPQTLSNGSIGISGLGAVSALAYSPNGQQVYVTSNGSSNSIVILNRAADGSLSYSQTIIDNSNGIDGLGGADDIAVTADGTYVYVAAANDSAFSVFTRNADGSLNFVDLLRNGENGINGLGGARAIALSPGGTHMYVAGFTNNAIAVLRTSGADLSVSISDSEDPIEIGNNVNYNITVNNNGPDQATGVGLTVTLPPEAAFISATPTQGNCAAAVNDVFTCTLGALDNGASTNISVVLAPNEPGIMQIAATATASQRDPSGATAEEQTTVTAVADLNVSMIADPDPASIRVDLAYQITVSNTGPDKAADIQVVNTLPANTEFVSASVGNNSTVCTFVDGTVACPIDSLNVGAQQTVTITIIPTIDGDLTNTVSVTSATRDPTVPNTASLTTRVRLRIIEDTYDNTGLELNNYAVTATGAVRGGIVSGTTVSEGLLYNLTVAEDSLVRGGQLANTITNNGILESVTLLSNTVINGGVVRGVITGFPPAPATLNTQIGGGTNLSHVIIGLGSVMDPTAVIGEGVRFVENIQIPPGLDLSRALNSITDPTSGSVAIDLVGDVLNGFSLLQAINALPELRDNGLAYVQTPDTGQLILRTVSENVTLLPMQLQQAEAGYTPGITINSDGSTQFITAEGRQLLAQPAIQQPAAFADSLRTLGLTQFSVDMDGNLTLPGAAQSAYFRARPARISQTTAANAPLGIEILSSARVANLPLVLSRFLDRTGVPRQQFVYPAIAHPAELRVLLEGMPDTQDVVFQADGTVSVTIDRRSYAGVADYVVTRGTPGNLTQFIAISDQNGDDIDDVRVFYKNGDQQVFFIVPLPELVTEIQAIPDVQAAGLQVAAVDEDTLQLSRGNERWLLEIVANERLPDGSLLPQMEVLDNGAVQFVTQTTRQLFTNPLVQDLALLQANLAAFGASDIAAHGDGNWLLSLDNDIEVSLRPALASTAADPRLTVGIRALGNGVLNSAYWQLLYADSAFTLRQQFLYPVAKEADALWAFFNDAPTVNQVALYNDGTVLVNTSAFVFRGLLSYEVLLQANLATGGVQFRQIADRNGDGLGDFEVVYANGDTQFIYQLLE